MKRLYLKLLPPFLWYEDYNYFSPFRSNLHAHPAWQLTLSLKDDFFFECHGKKISIKEGEWILFSPELLHRAGSECKSSRAIQIFFRHFPPALLPEFANKLNFRRDFFLTGTYTPGKSSMLAEEFITVLEERSSIPNSLKNLLPLKFITEALGEIASILPQQKNLPPEFLKVLTYMEENFRSPIGVPDFAALLNLSPSRFTAIFREAAGLSPMHYFNEIRLSYAQTLLLSGETIKNAALKSGFRSESYFCRKFKKYTGKTPGEFAGSLSEKKL